MGFYILMNKKSLRVEIIDHVRNLRNDKKNENIVFRCFLPNSIVFFPFYVIMLNFVNPKSIFIHQVYENLLEFLSIVDTYLKEKPYSFSLSSFSFSKNFKFF